MNPVDEHAEAIVDLCRKYNVKELSVFGSAVTEGLGPQSDIDLAVVFARTGYVGSFDQYFDFKTALETTLKRSVDLVCLASIRNSVFQDEVNRTKRTVYAA